jgi:predicted metal-dependent hydrolase
MQVAGIAVDVVRKKIKNLHLGVYPPDGRVRVAAPAAVSDEAVRLAVVDKLAWIKRQRSKFAEQPRQSRREMINGESHYFLGRRYRLRIREGEGLPHVAVRGTASLDLFVPRGASAEQREKVLARWHRAQLKALLSPLLRKWQGELGVQVSAWGIRKMKTKWGSCSNESRRVWFNLELAKKAPQCVEYIVVHELVHLLERHHDDRFTSYMDLHMPNWRLLRAQLNRAPLGHADWLY